MPGPMAVATLRVSRLLTEAPGAWRLTLELFPDWGAPPLPPGLTPGWALSVPELPELPGP